MKISKEKILSWLKKKDFETGLQLLKEARSRHYRTAIAKGPAYLDKIEKELRRYIREPITATVKPAKEMAAITAEQPQPPPAKQPSKKKKAKKQPAAKPTPAPAAKVKHAKPANTPKEEPYSLAKGHTMPVPPSVEKVAKEHARLFQLRSQLSDQRLKIPQTNHPENVKERRIITQSIHQISDRIEQLFEAHRAYTADRILPDMEALFPTPPKETPIEELEPGSRERLQKRRQSLMASNRKDRIELNYQDKTVKKKKNPLPDGPRRQKLEDRIRQRNAEILEIEKALQQMK